MSVRSAVEAFTARVQSALAWRARSLLGDTRVDELWVRIGRPWRAVLRGPKFIGVAGSVGKTTAKELLLGVLSRRGRVCGNPGSFSDPSEVAKVILRVRPSDEHCVVELGEQFPGSLNRMLELLRPAIGIVTVVGKDHWSAFGSREAIAQEVRRLVEALPATGTAVLNADDDLVRAMASRCKGRVITYGRSMDAALRAEEVSAVWPQRLGFTAIHEGRRVKVRTQLCGEHWIVSALAAIGGGLAAGLSLEECAAGVAGAAPFEGRMQPVERDDGVTFLRDDFKAPLWTMPTCIDYMTAARATRKIAVIGTISDAGTGAPQKYAKLAARWQEVADITIVVGKWAPDALKSRKSNAEGSLRVFNRVRDASRFVNAIARKGDLILLKGTNKQDHLIRIVMDREDAVTCWRDDCTLLRFCNVCPERNRQPAHPEPPRPDAEVRNENAFPAGCSIEVGDQVVVGFGNALDQYHGTPHNLGFEVLDRLARSLELEWVDTPQAWISRGAVARRNLVLVKVRGWMNETGARLAMLVSPTSVSPRQVILVHDDLATPLGAVRIRMNGGAGGHRGVASVLEAFQSDEFRRVKLGVKPRQESFDRVEYVLARFPAGERAVVDAAIEQACKRVHELIEQSVPARSSTRAP